MTYLNGIEINKVCRTCLGSSGDMKSLYEDVSSSKIRLAEMLMTFAPLRCYESDRLPAQICGNCIGELNQFHNFQLKCLETENILRNHLVKINDVVIIKQELRTESPNSDNIIVTPNPQQTEIINTDFDHFEFIKHEIETNEIKPNIENIRLDGLDIEFVNTKSLTVDPLRSTVDESILIESDSDTTQYETIDRKNTITLLPHQLALEKLSSSTTTTTTCTICTSEFSLKEHLIKHIITSHGGEKPYWCIVCNKTFSRAGYLRVHMRNHNGETHYKCQICRSLYKSKSSLLSHISKKHTPGIFACTNCDHSFKQPDLDLEEPHVISQNADKRVRKCSFCDRLFTRNFELKVHMRTHTGEKPFRCGICAKAFHRKQILNRHLHTVHSLAVDGKEIPLYGGSL